LTQCWITYRLFRVLAVDHKIVDLPMLELPKQAFKKSRRKGKPVMVDEELAYRLENDRNQ
jgi:hypothetical protein